MNFSGLCSITELQIRRSVSNYEMSALLVQNGRSRILTTEDDLEEVEEEENTKNAPALDNQLSIKKGTFKVEEFLKN